MNGIERLCLQRIATSPVSFTHAIDMRGKATKLARSSISPSQQKICEALAIQGFVSRAVSGDHSSTPPETSVTYTLTALGRAELDMKPERRAYVNHRPSVRE